MITLFGAKTPESSKISQTVVAFSYLVSLNTFLFYPPTNFTSFWKIFLTKKSMKLERLLCKDKSSQNFINATRDVKVAMLQVIAIGYHSRQRTILLLQQKYVEKDVKKQMSEPSNVCFHVFHKNPFTFPFECVQRRMMTFRMESVNLHWDAFKRMSDVPKIHWQRPGLLIPLFHLILSTNAFYLYEHISLNPYWANVSVLVPEIF